MSSQTLHTHCSVPGGCPHDALSEFKLSRVSMIFIFYQMTDVVSCGLCYGKLWQTIIFIRPEKVEHICEDSWMNIRKQLKEITDSSLVKKFCLNLKLILNMKNLIYLFFL